MLPCFGHRSKMRSIYRRRVSLPAHRLASSSHPSAAGTMADCRGGSCRFFGPHRGRRSRSSDKIVRIYGHPHRAAPPIRQRSSPSSPLYFGTCLLSDTITSPDASSPSCSGRNRAASQADGALIAAICSMTSGFPSAPIYFLAIRVEYALLSRATDPPGGNAQGSMLALVLRSSGLPVAGSINRLPARVEYPTRQKQWNRLEEHEGSENR